MFACCSETPHPPEFLVGKCNSGDGSSLAACKPLRTFIIDGVRGLFFNVLAIRLAQFFFELK